MIAAGVPDVGVLVIDWRTTVPTFAMTVAIVVAVAVVRELFAHFDRARQNARRIESVERLEARYAAQAEENRVRTEATYAAWRADERVAQAFEWWRTFELVRQVYDAWEAGAPAPPRNYDEEGPTP